MVLSDSLYAIYSFVVEEQLRKLNSVSKGVLMQVDGSLIYFIELEVGVRLDDKIRLAIEKQLEEVNLPKGQIFFLKFPVDRNQNDKIDHQKLRLLIKGY